MRPGAALEYRGAVRARLLPRAKFAQNSSLSTRGSPIMRAPRSLKAVRAYRTLKFSQTASKDTRIDLVTVANTLWTAEVVNARVAFLEAQEGEING